MNRRRMIQAASAAFASILVPARLDAAPVDPTLKLLRDARDELAPGVFAFNRDHGPNLKFSIEVGVGCVLVTGRCLRNNRALGFVFTKATIVDNPYYKTHFCPLMNSLVRSLTVNPTAEYERLFGSEAYRS